MDELNLRPFRIILGTIFFASIIQMGDITKTLANLCTCVWSVCGEKAGEGKREGKKEGLAVHVDRTDEERCQSN